MAASVSPFFMSIKDACKATGLSQSYLRKGCRDGSVPHTMNGTVYCINVPALLEKLGTPKEAVEHWIEECWKGGEK